jgi:phosphate butyryltransferase
MITSLREMAQEVLDMAKPKKVAVAAAEDSNTMGAVAKAAAEGMIEPLMVGNEEAIQTVAEEAGVDVSQFTIIPQPSGFQAARHAAKLVSSGEADVLMKGLVGTDKFLKAVMDKEIGLLPSKAVMSYVCAIELPEYEKLLFVTDTAVIPFPDLDQKVAMANYAIQMARTFGIAKPKIALIGASEKVSRHFPHSIDYAVMCKMSQRGQIENCIMDGPLDAFLACDPESMRIKKVDTPVAGQADILLFPSLESCNPFYKGLMLFGKGELAGLIQGTTKPVVVMSRSESEQSKYYCIALSCLMAEKHFQTVKHL